jgi:hypothetical protein
MDRPAILWLIGFVCLQLIIFYGNIWNSLIMILFLRNSDKFCKQLFTYPFHVKKKNLKLAT